MAVNTEGGRLSLAVDTLDGELVEVVLDSATPFGDTTLEVLLVACSFEATAVLFERKIMSAISGNQKQKL